MERPKRVELFLPAWRAVTRHRVERLLNCIHFIWLDLESRYKGLLLGYKRNLLLLILVVLLLGIQGLNKQPIGCM